MSAGRLFHKVVPMAAGIINFGCWLTLMWRNVSVRFFMLVAIRSLCCQATRILHENATSPSVLQLQVRNVSMGVAGVGGSAMAGVIAPSCLEHRADLLSWSLFLAGQRVTWHSCDISVIVKYWILFTLCSIEWIRSTLMVEMETVLVIVALLMYQSVVSQKSSPPPPKKKTFCGIFTHDESAWLKITSLLPNHIPTCIPILAHLPKYLRESRHFC